MGTELSGETKILLTKPLPLDGDYSHGDQKSPNLMKRVLGVLKDIGPGTDLTKMQLPPQLNLPKSHMQLYGESLYCVGDDMLGKCNRGESPVERFTAALAWTISLQRPWILGLSPYNAVLGETNHVSRGTLNVLLEQVSHHPPVTALHATDEKQHLEVLWCLHPVPKFYGTSVEVVVHGKRQLKLLNHGETYEMNTPKLLFRFFPVPKVEWAGSQRIRCEKTDLEAEFSYVGKSFLGFKGNPRSVKGKIFCSSSLKPIFEIDGQWDKTITLKDLASGEVRVIYNAKKVLSELKTPIVKDPKAVWPTESAAVWSVVNEGILDKDWTKAKEAKKVVEEKQRELLKERKSKGESWVPKHFSVSYSKKDGWDCSPIEMNVPPAPIIVPF